MDEDAGSTALAHTSRVVWIGIAVTLVGFFIAPWGSFVTRWTAVSQLEACPVLALIPILSAACTWFEYSGKHLLVLAGGLVGLFGTSLIILCIWTRPLFFARIEWGIPATLAGFAAIAYGGFRHVRDQGQDSL